MKTKPHHFRFFKATRHNMYKDIIDHIPEGFDPANILFVSSDYPLVELFWNSKKKVVKYPEYDVCNLHQIEDNQYECVICDQVIEHVENPFDAVNEMYRVLKPDGVMILTTVFMYPIHEWPKDYWRFAPDGLRKLCEKFQVIHCDGWGNQEMVKLIADLREKGKSVPHIKDKEVSGLLDISNPETPLTTWIIARK